MKLPPFDYMRPTTIDEALAVMGDRGDEAKVLAGGQSLLPLMAFRLSRPALLVDVSAIPEMHGVESVDGALVVGAATTQATVEDSPVVRGEQPLLAEAVPWIGHRPIRSRGTIGGSLSHCDPAAELPLVATVLDAEVEVHSARGARTVPASELFVGFFDSAVDDDEVLTRVRIPVAPRGSGSAFDEIARRHGDFAMVSAAAQVVVGADLTLAEVRLGLGAVASRPLRLREVEDSLVGVAVDGPVDAVVREACRAVPALLDPPDDVHATSHYRRTVAGSLAAQVLTRAIQRAMIGAEVAAA